MIPEIKYDKEKLLLFITIIKPSCTGWFYPSGKNKVV